MVFRNLALSLRSPQNLKAGIPAPQRAKQCLPLSGHIFPLQASLLHANLWEAHISIVAPPTPAHGIPLPPLAPGAAQPPFPLQVRWYLPREDAERPRHVLSISLQLPCFLVCGFQSPLFPLLALFLSGPSMRCLA